MKVDSGAVSGRDYASRGALGPQDAGHAADVTGRRVIGCPESTSFAPRLDVE